MNTRRYAIVKKIEELADKGGVMKMADMILPDGDLETSKHPKNEKYRSPATIPSKEEDAD